MRKEFAQSIINIAKSYDKLIFITGDIGFNALEEVKEVLGNRFINAGVAEQNIMGLAAGLAKQGFHPFVYSIAPFIVYRGYEQIRNDITFHNLPVVITGNGGGYGYGIMGATHHAIEDYGALSLLNIKCIIPMINNDVEEAVKTALSYNGPVYLRLGYGSLDNKISEFKAWRQLLTGNNITIATIGSIGINSYLAAEQFSGKADLWSVGEIPFKEIPSEFIDSVNKTKKLICIEEHVKRGGFGEYLVSKLIENGCSNFCLELLTAKGYPSGTYGSQNFHRKESGIDIESIKTSIIKMAEKREQ